MRASTGALWVAALAIGGCQERGKPPEPAASVLAVASDGGRAPAEAQRAILVATKDFSENLADLRDAGSEVELFLGRMENYEVVVSEATEPGSWRIEFHPKRFPGGGLKGGGIEYTVAKDTLVITKRELYE